MWAKPFRPPLEGSLPAVQSKWQEGLGPQGVDESLLSVAASAPEFLSDDLLRLIELSGP